jgi:hypothetical protein
MNRIQDELAAIRHAEISHPARDGRRVLCQARMRLETTIQDARAERCSWTEAQEAADEARRTRLAWAGVS